MNEYLVKTLKEGRLSKGLKQSDVAEMVGVKANTLSNYENGVSEPDIDTFASLCDIYGLDFAYVLGEAYGLNVQGNIFSIKPSEIEHIKKYRALDEKGREVVNTILDNEYERYLQRIEMEKNLPPFFKMLEEMEQQQTHKTINDKSKVYQFDVSPTPSMVADSSVPYTTAARNDFINEPGELEKTKQDIKNLKRPE